MSDDTKKLDRTLREGLHLTSKEIEDYLEGRASRSVRSSIEDHLRTCEYCAKEVDILRSVLASDESEDEPVLGFEEAFEAVLGFEEACDEAVLEFEEPIDPVVGFTLGPAGGLMGEPRKKPPTDTKLWIGDRKYILSSEGCSEGFLLVEGLTKAELVRSRWRDIMDPGSHPVAIETPGQRPIITSLDEFTAEDEADAEAKEEPAVQEEAEAKEKEVFRAFVPAYALEMDTESEMLDKRVDAYGERREAEHEESEPQRVLAYQGAKHFIEFFTDRASRIFVRFGPGRGRSPR